MMAEARVARRGDDVAQGAGKDCAWTSGVADNALLPAPDDDVLSSASTDLGQDCPEIGRRSSAGSDGSCFAVDQPPGFTMAETLIIFDWDDTILPTSWLGEQGLLDSEQPPSEEQASRLQLVAEEASATLRAARARGNVVVVTNAGEGWVELSCRMYMPALLPLVQNLEVISARTAYEEGGIYAPTDWKCRAFAQKLTNFYSTDHACYQRQNVISLGDSMYERKALMWATSCMPACRAKSLKFMERPTIERLAEQHQLVAGCLDQVIDYDGPLDYEVDMAQSEGDHEAEPHC